MSAPFVASLSHMYRREICSVSFASRQAAPEGGHRSLSMPARAVAIERERTVPVTRIRQET